MSRACAQDILTESSDTSVTSALAEPAQLQTAGEHRSHGRTLIQEVFSLLPFLLSYTLPILPHISAHTHAHTYAHTHIRTHTNPHTHAHTRAHAPCTHARLLHKQSPDPNASVTFSL